MDWEMGMDWDGIAICDGGVRWGLCIGIRILRGGDGIRVGIVI